METTLSAGVQGIKKVLLPSVLINVLSLAVPLTVLQVYDRIIPNQSYGTATLLIAGAALAVLLDAFLRYVRSRVLASESAIVEQERYAKTVRALATSPVNDIKRLRVGSIQNGLESIAKIKDIYSGGLMSGLIDIPFAVLFLFLVYYVGGSLVAVPVVVWSFTFAFVWLSGRRAKQRSLNHANTVNLRSGFLLNLYRNILGIKRQANEYKTLAAYKEINQQHSLSIAEDERHNALAQECIYLASLGTSVVIVIAGASHVLSGELTTGGLAACSILAGRAVAPLSALTSLNIRFANMQTSIQSVKALFSLPSYQADPLKSEENIKTITFNCCATQRFSYLYQTSKTLEAGNIYRVSSDKKEVASQFLTTIAGVSSEDAGTIHVNETERNPFTRSVMSSYIGSRSSVLQGSILDNLCGFTPELSEKALYYSKALGLHQVLTQLSDGLETKLADLPSIPLSQSSIRLINICCQLARPTPIICIDKPELDLDVDTWPKLAEVLSIEAEHNRTIFVVTHNSIFSSLCSDTLTLEQVPSGGQHDE
ncbi:ABC transporter transmembrane domain-containing protein [Vibrio hangzhouensis]|uniref:ABC transporter transmembrane domain-containing protein n=1 Tax=Vibrio hangzhouensis TaxID=462991 RepID=UPI001C98D38F|nr:ABC transporter transmembrane domain-containing protein [Vibrio hangzhouensis]MBY6196823.1 ABC transporter [Vibrio hangzhouensis]